MAYSAPTITAAGLSVPSFSDIQAALIASYQAIYGSTVYLGNDSADYQWISAVSLKINDAIGLCILAYNARSPLTAIGADLDSVVKLNGITRLSSSPSTAVLTLSGVPLTEIINAVISDVNGILWSLPASVIIGVGGTVTATATCQQSGAVSANPGTITNPVGGFTAGWTGVTNSSPAVVGTPVQSDSSLRAYQSIAVATPSSTRLAGTQGDIQGVPGVTRTNILENQTSVTDSYGNESHSLTCVVEGGVDLAVATAIYDNRGIGCNTQGATVPTMTIVAVTDPNTGNVTDIGFVRPTYEDVYVGITVHGLNDGFTTATQTAIIAAIVTYLNDLEIGEAILQSSLYGAALSVMPNQLQPLFSIKSLTLGLSASTLFSGTIGNNAGTGYLVGDILTVVQAGASGGTLTVLTIGAGGAITSFDPTATTGGTLYSTANNLATTGGTGTGATVDIKVAPTTTADLTLLFYEVALGLTANIVLAAV